MLYNKRLKKTSLILGILMLLLPIFIHATPMISFMEAVIGMTLILLAVVVRGSTMYFGMLLSFISILMVILAFTLILFYVIATGLGLSDYFSLAMMMIAGVTLLIMYKSKR